MGLFSIFAVPRATDAEAELRSELQSFAYDGLVQLQMDLRTQNVKRGTWEGCVLSYRLGAPGSVSCDRKGRRGNAFTRFWDTERIPQATVLRLIAEEMNARRDQRVPAGEVVLVVVD